MGTLQLFSVGMQKNRHGDHTENEASQTQADDEHDGCGIHRHLLLAIAAAATTTKEHSTKDEAKETKAYQKPEVHL